MADTEKRSEKSGQNTATLHILIAVFEMDRNFWIDYSTFLVFYLIFALGIFLTGEGWEVLFFMLLAISPVKERRLPVLEKAEKGFCQMFGEKNGSF